MSLSDKPFLALQNKPFPQMLHKILDFHLIEKSVILDCTYGEGYSWADYEEKIKFNHMSFFPYKEYKLIKRNGGPKICKNLEIQVDGIFFDPPYIFDIKGTTDDVRQKDYGEYFHTYSDIAKIIQDADKYFPKIIKKDGKLFFKYCDVFSLKQKKFFLTIVDWIGMLSNFEPVDHYIIQHHHISPTAYQVKNRPCGIVNYTYLTVLKLKQ